MDHSIKKANAAYPLNAVLAGRYSPRAFSERAIDDGELRSLLEAARWAASCYNEQPWRFLVAPKSNVDAFEKMLGCLAPANQVWAKDAAVLMISVAKLNFDHNCKVNRFSAHDVGLAVGQLIWEASQRGIALHQMGGFDVQRARERYLIGTDYEPMAAIALGYAADASVLPQALQEGENAVRQRQLQQRLVFGPILGEPLVLPSEMAVEGVLAFWFGELDPLGRAKPETRATWWKKSPDFDGEIRKRFSGDYDAILAGERDDWLQTARGRLAYIIVLDQFSRNMFRDSGKMYAADQMAVDAALVGIDKGDAFHLEYDQRKFLYMPLMHSEELAVQERCVEVFEAAWNAADDELKDDAAGHVGYAVKHRDIVRDWGRFPHRNAILGRQSTAEELEFLKGPNSSF